MKKIIFMFIALLGMVFTLASCDNDDNNSYYPASFYTGVYTAVNASTGYSTMVVVNPNGTYDHISVKSATQESVVDVTTMMSINTYSGVASITDQGLGGWTGKVIFSNNGKTAKMELTNAQGTTMTADLTKVTYPTTLAGNWVNGSTGGSLTVNLQPLGVADTGTIKFSASDTAKNVTVGAIDNYGKGTILINGQKASFSINTTEGTPILTLTYDKQDYTFTYAFK